MKQNITKDKCPDCSVGNEEYCTTVHNPVKGMKQNISKKQWDELDKKHQKVWNEVIEKCFDLPTIGQMIEFLGDDLKQIIHWEIGYRVELKGHYEAGMEICNILWEAVKYKLNDTNTIKENKTA